MDGKKVGGGRRARGSARTPMADGGSHVSGAAKQNAGTGAAGPLSQLEVSGGTILVNNGSNNVVIGSNEISFSKADGPSYIRHNGNDFRALYLQAGTSGNNKLGVNEYGVKVGNALSGANGADDPILNVIGDIKASGTVEANGTIKAGGGVRLGDPGDCPDAGAAGTIRYKCGRFQGWTGSAWVFLDGAW